MATCDWTVILCNAEISSTHGKTQPSPQWKSLNPQMEVMNSDFVDFVQIQVTSLQKRKARILGDFVEKRKSPTPWILSNLGTLSTYLEIVEFNLDTLDSFCWISGRIPVDPNQISSGQPIRKPLTHCVCCWGNEKAQAKEAAKVWAGQKIRVQKEQVPIQQKRIIIRIIRSYDVVCGRLVLVFTRLLPKLHDAKRSWRQRRLRRQKFT